MVTTSSNCNRNFSAKLAKLAMKNRPHFLADSWRKHREPCAAGRGTCLPKQAEGGFGEPADETRPKPCVNGVQVNWHLVLSQEASPKRWLGLKIGNDSEMTKGQFTKEEIKLDLDLGGKKVLISDFVIN